MSYGLKVKTLPAFNDWVNGEVTANEEKDEVDTTEKVISFNVIVTAYKKGKEVVYQL